jgi:adenylate cyclase
VRQRLIRILLGLAVTLFFAAYAGRALQLGLVDRLDKIIYDTRLRLTMPGAGDPRVVILDIDEKSLGEVGRWPWSRNVMARLMDRLFDQYGIAVLGFDVVWAERDASSGMDILDALASRELRNVPGFQSAYRQLRPGLDYDGLFASSLKGRPVVLGYYLSSEARAVRANVIPEPVLPAGAFAGRFAPLTQWNGYTGNLAAVMANAAGAGHFNPIVDEDGVVRSVPLLAELDGAYYEAFSLAVARAWLARSAPDRRPPPVQPGFADDGVSGMEWLAVGPLTVPVNEQAAALVPYAGPPFSFPYLSLADVLAGRVPADRLKDRIALIGTTAPGLLDMRSTPVQSVYPGVEIHANLIAGMLNGQLKSKPGYIVGAEVALVLLAGCALSVLLPLLSALWATVAAGSAIGLLVALDVLLWTRADTVLPLAASLLMAAAVYTLNMAYGYFVETRSKRAFTELFGQYVPPELVDRMAADPGRYSMEPRAADLTILFSDVRGFTGISESLRPDALREYIDGYLTAMSSIIRSQYRGTLDKYIGDAIMAFWGAPVEDPQHARNGVLAALQMQRECKVLNEKFTARGWPPIRIGVGLNTGNVRVGDMGSRTRRAYTVLGDAVNIASRLEGCTKHYDVGILVGEATRREVQDIAFREVDRLRVKGKEKAITVFEPLGPASGIDAATREELALWDEALRDYRSQRWDDAEARLAELRRRWPERGLYAKFRDKVEEHRRAPPPPDWDGVTVFHEK